MPGSCVRPSASHRRSDIVPAFVGIMLAAYLWFGAGQALKYAEVMARLPRIDLQRVSLCQ